MNNSSGITITCGQCGKTSDIDRWTSRPLSGELPAAEFQCPLCRYAFRRQAAGAMKIIRDARGRAVDAYPERVELRPVTPRL